MKKLELRKMVKIIVTMFVLLVLLVVIGIGGMINVLSEVSVNLVSSVDLSMMKVIIVSLTLLLAIFCNKHISTDRKTPWLLIICMSFALLGDICFQFVSSNYGIGCFIIFQIFFIIRNFIIYGKYYNEKQEYTEKQEAIGCVVGTVAFLIFATGVYYFHDKPLTAFYVVVLYISLVSVLCIKILSTYPTKDILLQGFLLFLTGDILVGIQLSLEKNSLLYFIVTFFIWIFYPIGLTYIVKSNYNINKLFAKHL